MLPVANANTLQPYQTGSNANKEKSGEKPRFPIALKKINLVTPPSLPKTEDQQERLDIKY